MAMSHIWILNYLSLLYAIAPERWWSHWHQAISWSHQEWIQCFETDLDLATNWVDWQAIEQYSNKGVLPLALQSMQGKEMLTRALRPNLESANQSMNKRVCCDKLNICCCCDIAEWTSAVQNGIVSRSYAIGISWEDCFGNIVCQ